MGYSQAGKAENHERIVEIAARRLREAGVEGLGVAALMQEAGMTHGGFYRHFPSRDALVVEAVGRALDEGGARTARAASMAALIEAYLSPAHRDSPATGCALPALAADVARGTEAARARYGAQVARSVAAIAQRLAAERGDPAATATQAAARDDAMLMLSAMVGALSLARAVDDPQLSDAILEAVRGRLTALAPG